MARQKATDCAGVMVPAAYIRVDRTVVEHKTSIYVVVRTYADAQHAADRAPIPGTEQGFTFPWPVDASGASVAVDNPVAFGYGELSKLPAFAGATAV